MSGFRGEIETKQRVGICNSGWKYW